MGFCLCKQVDRRGLPAAPSSFTSAGMFKIFSRRAPSQPSTSTVSPSLSFEHDDEGIMSRSTTSTEPTTPSSQTQQVIEPIYGPPNDQGDEVRFSVEVTRIDRLDDLLSLDIRRLKGQLKSYKFLYDTIRE
jgi:protein-serine/threonine kinase